VTGTERMMKMVAIPKPPKSKAAAAGIELTETDFLEIGERIGESKEFRNHRWFLSMQIGYENVKINMNNIVSVK
jgi:hypothetical protein